MKLEEKNSWLVEQLFCEKDVQDVYDSHWWKFFHKLKQEI